MGAGCPREHNTWLHRISSRLWRRFSSKPEVWVADGSHLVEPLPQESPTPPDAGTTTWCRSPGGSPDRPPEEVSSRGHLAVEWRTESGQSDLGTPSSRHSPQPLWTEDAWGQGHESSSSPKPLVSERMPHSRIRARHAPADADPSIRPRPPRRADNVHRNLVARHAFRWDVVHDGGLVDGRHDRRRVVEGAQLLG